MQRRTVLSGLIAILFPGLLPSLVEAAPPTPPATKMVRCKNIDTMLDAIADHARRTGEAILSADEPKRLMVGFAAVRADGSISTHWTIYMLDRQLSPLARSDPRRAELLRACLRTAEGRRKLAASFPRGSVPFTC